MQIETSGADVRIGANAHVATIVLDRPARRNAITRPTANALADENRRNELHADGSGPGPPGPARMALSRPTITAITGYAVAGGLERALRREGAHGYRAVLDEGLAGADRHGDPLDV